ncbi:hypothetical protein [Actinacidiphila paucisporea]|uniref:Uncharacterized protein n=1 Tax=Actinacidiphila paucisporea TaxID=310782 RepID=A0A1M6ULZ4_9ACTN|nr:hypothetical protein [Actinacidiphila paucisporea]SHK70265.1 hypothetical protein SAMN05216499_101415 [Actinacidiphila paucisporea]
MTTDQVLIGTGLLVVLAVGSQLLAGRLRIPALIVLLPVGFAAGALIGDVDPQRLLGAAFSPLVSLAVAVILYDAGLGLDLGRLKGHNRRVVTRLLGVVRRSRSRPLLVGGAPWAVALGSALKSTGMEVLMWAGHEQERHRIRQAGIELAAGEMPATATGGGAELEGTTGVYLLTDEDDFNALATAILRGGVEGPVHRVGAAAGSHGVVAPYIGGEILFGTRLTGPDLARRHRDGGTVVARSADRPIPPDSDLLFVVRSGDRLVPVTEGSTPAPEPGDTLVLLVPAQDGRPSRRVG